MCVARVARRSSALATHAANPHPSLLCPHRSAAQVFPAANLMTSIPIFSVMVRYNLVNAKLMSPWPANLVAIGLPWALALVFYSGNALGELINWSSAAFFGAVNLVLPPLLFLAQERLALGGGGVGGGGAASDALLNEDEAAEAAAAGFDEGLDLAAKNDDGGGGGGGGARSGGLFALRGMGVGASSRGLLSIELPAAAAAGRSAGSGVSVTSINSPTTPSAVSLEFVEDIRPVPLFCRTMCVLDDSRLSWLLLGSAVAISALSLVLQAYSEYEADT